LTDGAARPAPARPRWPWFLIGGLAAGAVLLILLSGGGGPAPGTRALPFLLAPADLGDDYSPTSPPVDLGNVERLARASLGAVPLPADKAIASWRRPDTGEQVTQAVLVYDDPAAASRLDALAVSALPGAFGLAPAPLSLPGAEDARTWTSPGYHAITFRRGGVAYFVGTSASDPVEARRLAEALLRRPLPTVTVPKE
jgi:hypothetical protein